MASGCWLIAAKCHSEHNSLNTDEVVRAWILLPTHKEKVSLPEVTNAVYYRKEIALGLRLSKTRWRRTGWSCLTAKTTDSTANSTEARRRLFTTSEGTRAKVKKDYEIDRQQFQSLRGTVSKIRIDDWAIVFEGRPSAITRQVAFGGAMSGYRSV